MVQVVKLYSLLRALVTVSCGLLPPSTSQAADKWQVI